LISENQRLTLNGWAFDSLASKANIVMDAIMSAIGPKRTSLFALQMSALTQSGHASKDVVSNASAALAPLRSTFNQSDGALRAISVQVRACSAARVDNVFRAVPANRRKLRLSVP